MFNVKSEKEVFNLIKEQYTKLELETIVLNIEDSLNYVLAEDILSTCDVPHFDRSVVDGYAVKYDEIQGSSDSSPAFLTLQGEVKMGEPSKYRYKENCCVYVPTGGHLPDGNDSVVMIENTEKVGDSILIKKATSQYENVMRKGNDISIGAVVLAMNHTVNPQDIGLLATLGITKVKVYRKLKCALYSTGTEIVPHTTIPNIGQIRDANLHSLNSLLCSYNIEVISKKTCVDDYDILKSNIESDLSDVDMVILSGGSSVGEKDYTYKIFNELGEVFVHGIAVKPGKPTVFAKYNNKPLIGLPGQPTSAFIVARNFIPSIISSLNNTFAHHNTYISCIIDENIKGSPGRKTFIPVKIYYKDDKVYCSPVYGKSGYTSLLSRSDGYFTIPENTEGIKRLLKVKVTTWR